MHLLKKVVHSLFSVLLATEMRHQGSDYIAPSPLEHVVELVSGAQRGAITISEVRVRVQDKYTNLVHNEER
jgi:hypothetical protein